LFFITLTEFPMNWRRRQDSVFLSMSTLLHCLQ